MKRLKGFEVVGLIFGIVVFAIIVIGAIFIISGNNKMTNYNDYDFHSVIEPTRDNGNIGDHIKGDPNAPVKIFEYADYQCEGCAAVNPRVNKVVEELDGKLAIVYRSFLLPYHKNATAAASSAEAAGLQGYWKEYADKLFSEQSEWYYATASERTALFEKYFEEVTNGEGDLEKFREDVSSDAVSKKINFDLGIAKRINVAGTPSFYIDGQLIDWGDSDKDGVGSVTVNGQTVSWEGSQTGEDFIKLIKRIVSAKLGE